MQSFQKLAVVIALMLFSVSKEVIALPQPHVASSDSGSVGNQIDTASVGTTGDNSASSSNDNASKFFIPFYRPYSAPYRGYNSVTNNGNGNIGFNGNNNRIGPY